MMKLLKENNYIKGFEIQYVEQEQQQECCISIDASQVYIGDEIFYYFMIHDVTLEHQQAKMSHYLAYHDPLTGIYNRAFFEQTVKEALMKNKPEQGAALVLSDLNFFKAINDTYGHQVGDDVLRFTAQSLSLYLPQPVVLARLGGDEFIMYFEITSRQVFEADFQKMRQLFHENWFREKSLEIEVVPSFGMAYTSELGTDYDTLYHACDLAMYEDKKQIKQTYQTT